MLRKVTHMRMRCFSSENMRRYSRPMLGKHILLPLAQHPIFPQASVAIELTKSQFETLKTEDTVFASILTEEAAKK